MHCNEFSGEGQQRIARFKCLKWASFWYTIGKHIAVLINNTAKSYTEQQLDDLHDLEYAWNGQLKKVLFKHLLIPTPVARWTGYLNSI